MRNVYGLVGWLAVAGGVLGCGNGGDGGGGGSPDGGGAVGDGPVASADGPRADGGPIGSCDVVGAVNGLTLHVNPIAGDDATGTGSASAAGHPSPGCAFRSITRALVAAGAAAKTSMNVVVDVTATAGSAETFPLVLPPNTTLAAAAGATVTVLVGAGEGVHLSGATSAIDSVILDGQGVAATGVVVTAGPTTLSGVEIKGFTSAGVRANDGATLTLTAGASVHDDGVGLVASGNALVSIDGTGATEQHPTQIATNAGSGVEVRGQARVNVAGALSQQTAGAGTVVVKDNALDGILVEQLLVAEGSAPPAGMTVTGLVATLNQGSGLHLFGGSGIKVRGSYLSGNTGQGVLVQTDPAFIPGGAGANDGNDISRLDFGVAGDLGNDVLQDVGNPNGKKGACVDVTSGSSLNGPLKLEGNVFATGGTSVDCVHIAGSLPATQDCDSEGPLGSVGRNPKNDFDVALCTLP